MVRQSVVEAAASAGSLEMLRFFHENDRNDGAEGEDEVSVNQGHVVQWGHNDAVQAARHGHSEVVMWLFEHTIYFHRYMPNTVKAAVGSGDIALVEWLLDHNGTVGVDPRPERGVHDAAANGHVAMLQWLADGGYYNQTDGVLVKAAEKGQLEVVRWIIDRDWGNEEEDRDIDSDDDAYGGASYGGYSERLAHITDLGGEANFAIHAAAVNGHLEVAKYLRARVDTPLNRRDRTRHEQGLHKMREAKYQQLGGDVWYQTDVISEKTMLLAAGKGYLDVVKWVYEEFSVDPDIDLFAPGVHRPSPEWQRKKITLAFDAAASNGHLEIVQYLHGLEAAIQVDNSRKRKRDETMEDVGPVQDVDILDTLYVDANTMRLRRNGTTTVWTLPCTTAAMDNAAANNHLDVVQWLHNNRTEGCSSDAMDLAACSGHLEMVQWLHHNRTEGCTTDAMDDAAGSGSLDLVKWLHENRTEGCTTGAMDGAARNGHIEVVKWLHHNRLEGCTTTAMVGAACCGSLDLVKWLHANRTEGCTTGALDLAPNGGNLQVVKWLHEHRSEGCTADAGYFAVVCSEFEIALCLHLARNAGCAEGAAAGTLDSSTMDIHEWVLEHFPALRD